MGTDEKIPPMFKTKVRRPRFEAVFQNKRREQAFSRARGYAELYRGSTPDGDFLNQRLARVLERLSSIGGGKLFDAGCGPGILLSRLVGGPFELFGIDSNLEMIREVEAVTAGQAVHVAVARLEQVPYPGEFFDVILAMGVLEYADVEAALRELARVAKPNAIILVSMLNRDSLYWYWHLHVYRAWTAFKSRLSGGRSEPFATPHKEEVLKGIMKKYEIEPLVVTYYNVNICVEPLASRYWGLASRLNHTIENRVGKKFSRLVHTGFIIEAVKRRSAEAATHAVEQG